MKNTSHLPELRTAPAVFAVKDEYQIMAISRSEILFCVTVNGVDYYDHTNGIIRSAMYAHRVSVPMSELDAAGEYTVSYRRIIDRLPYFSTTEEPVSQTYKFKPLPKEGDIKIYHLSDTHGHFTMPAQAGEFFGDNIDLLILNGDIPDHSGNVRNFDLIYRLCEAITGGERPIVFSRGNHDTRGIFAEKLADYTPTENGHSYFTFRLGRIWGIVMDTGEDKPDDHEAYGHTNACHQFRLEETRYLEKIIENADKEYAAPGVQYRLVIVHNPFTLTLSPPFDIEQPLYKKWADMLKETVKPQAMIVGHIHQTGISPIGGKWDSKGQPCPVISASKPTKVDGHSDHVGTAFTLSGDKMKVEFTDGEHTVLESATLDLIK